MRKNGSPIDDVKRSFHAACREAGIDDFRLHDCRHTYAAWLVQAGTPLAVVRDLLGHATVQMTERYSHLAPGATREAVNRLSRNADQSQSSHIEEPNDALRLA